YDYTENRIGSLSAHVTASEGRVHTDFEQVDGRWQPEPAVKESRRTGTDQYGRPEYVVRRDEHGKPVYEFQPLSGRTVVRVAPSPWTGNYDADTGLERGLIEGFLREVVDAIAEVAQAEAARIHFYVWARSEIAQLVEGCTRGGTRLLGALRELLGCR